MNLQKPNSPKIKNNFIYLSVLIFAFLTFVFINRQSLFIKFGPNLINNYLRSQDILDTENKIKDRILISDSDIYIASGYMYANGIDPRKYNFQHPPFIKYLFGLSSKYFNLPLLPNIFFAGFLILGVYLLGINVFKNPTIGFLASILLMFDPVFKEVTIYALLDLGQIVFILWFLIISLFYPKHYLIEGILLGLALASKFWTPVLIFLGILYIYKLLVMKINIKNELIILFIAFLTFCLTYVVSFIKSDGLFNIFFWQAKLLKFMLEHNVATKWGSTLKMFFGGYLLWPIIFFVNLYLLFKTKIKEVKFLIYLLPILYLFLLTFQLSFTRYFILILPFLYLSLGKFVVSKLKK
ncbi:hypothetical protein A2422_00245 [Candidatus Woesebacteria bacterium RIFOXYC1_FULL_31_51]|uniref:Glycosyltransferase RgtA/B/C/D-like domain-containing protein n=1 Tax=Candidatus Woesebacteria bacterium GW2011_GWC2_31_9 TaxID=1618586 RepID=A0A0F9YZ55_9BACT|nr:MAG: hypothetical protein UR17_C0001G0434 [Candidatus Woesebacteria bacterium GW2011_GWF1_31_35]KKP23080.1 MAG: hypothetical protein UR11_C0001G0054 [Candidatus Woesebacteria bacterium GW2011_GWC1_30_29]KKP26768.1 MAG: hypothetical protein UR13_C0002G0003 [Candidatus Woesebacteria bacterium GW2011_GWD1_31_12]KKP27343.1 MAG: hypothetical protein UR16_C0003G0003 [Candidatus Woesebacteria bacterium GW2011_GWB1_31_29]KKP31631.1 MAG: hypothetical protein UR21_C0007G0048 [Candidatus Woesebacteria 